MSSAKPRKRPADGGWDAKPTSRGRRPRATARVSRAAGKRSDSRILPRKAPAQDRSRATVEAILEAAIRLFAISGYARTTTNEIALRAGVSVGSLYQYFPNKDAILNALTNRHVADVDGVIEQSLVELRDGRIALRAVLHRMLARFLDVHDRDPLLTRAVEQAGQLPRLPKAHHRAENAYVAALRQVLSERPEIRRGNPALMAGLLVEAVESVVAWLAHGGGRDFERPAALAEAVELVARYLEG